MHDLMLLKFLYLQYWLKEI